MFTLPPRRELASLLRLALPIVAVQVGLMLMGVVDTLMVGRVSAAALAAVALGIWDLLDTALGRSLAAQLVSLSAALTAGGLVYLGAVRTLRVPEMEQIVRLVRRR